jgi:hypothetical protein
MTRIFTALAIVLTLALAATFVIGFWSMALALSTAALRYRFGLGLLLFAGFVLGLVGFAALAGRAAAVFREQRLSLLLVPLILLVALGAGMLAQAAPTTPTPDQVYLIHFTAGLFTALGALFVHCIIFTYFLGTGRWVKEVGIAYELPDTILPRETRELKRTVFPAALRAMLIVIITVATGAGRRLEDWPWTVHYALAILTLHINLWAFVVEFRCLSRNAEIIDAVLGEVDRIRRERGLPPNAEAV